MKLTRGQLITLTATSLPMAAIGVAGGVASFYNFRNALGADAGALSIVLAGEGATAVAAMIMLSLTLMGQHSPTVVRAALWLLPMVASAAGVAVAPDFNTQVIMAVAPLAVTTAGEGVALVARRVVRNNTGVDLEAQRRAGLLVWHSGRAANGGWLARRMSKAAVWRLTKAFAASDAQMAIQVDDVQRFRISENLDGNLLAALTGDEPKATPAPALKAAERPSLPVSAPAWEPAPILNPDALSAPTTALASGVDVTAAADSFDFIREVLAEAETRVEEAPEPSDLMTVADVAAAKGVSQGTVRSWLSRGKLAKVGTDADGRTLVSRLDVSKL